MGLSSDTKPIIIFQPLSSSRIFAACCTRSRRRTGPQWGGTCTNTHASAYHRGKERPADRVGEHGASACVHASVHGDDDKCTCTYAYTNQRFKGYFALIFFLLLLPVEMGPRSSERPRTSSCTSCSLPFDRKNQKRKPRRPRKPGGLWQCTRDARSSPLGHAQKHVREVRRRRTHVRACALLAGNGYWAGQEEGLRSKNKDVTTAAYEKYVLHNSYHIYRYI